MSSVFDHFYRKHINAEHKRNFERYNPGQTYNPRVEEKKKKEKTSSPGTLSEGKLSEVDPLAGLGMAPAPGAPAAPAPQASASKGFTQIVLDSKNWLEKKQVDMGNLPEDSPELAVIRSATGLLSQYMPAPGENNNSIADKVGLLSKELHSLVGEGGAGEITDYIGTLSDKLEEFRSTIDVGNATPSNPNDTAASEEPPAPKPEKAPVEPAPKQNDPGSLAKGLELNVR